MDNEYLLDFTDLGNKEEIHEYLYDNLGLPDYYGNNLDALYDCLTDFSECSITLTGLDALYEIGDYGMKLIKVFQNAAKDNDSINLIIEDID